MRTRFVGLFATAVSVIVASCRFPSDMSPTCAEDIELCPQSSREATSVTCDCHCTIGGGDNSANNFDGKVAWYEQPAVATGTWTEHIIATGVSPLSVDAADMDGDGDIDILTAGSADNRIALLVNNGSQEFTRQDLTRTATLGRSVAARRARRAMESSQRRPADNCRGRDQQPGHAVRRGAARATQCRNSALRPDRPSHIEPRKCRARAPAPRV